MKRREDNPPMDKPRKESLILSYTRNQRRRQRKQHILTGAAFAILLMLCICIPGWAEYIVVDSPAGIYSEVS